MKQVTIHEAKTHLSRLIRDVIAGDEVIIARGSTPLVRLVPLDSSGSARRFGGLKDAILHVAEDFDSTLDDFGEYE